jgi:hypothetical protein
MTKYVLNSGGVRKHPDLARKFFGEMVEGLGTSPKILICCFAQPRDKWEEKIANGIRAEYIFPEGITPCFELAFPDTFEAQIRDCDAIYIHGGIDHLLLYWLRQYNLPALWEGKVVATNSASSNALAKHFWTCDWRKNFDGLGILPLKFLSHYDSSYGSDDPRGPIDWATALQALKNYGDTTLPVHALKEGEYVVIMQ